SLRASSSRSTESISTSPDVRHIRSRSSTGCWRISAKSIRAMELNSTEVAALLSVPEKEVREWAHAGRLPHLDAQGRLRFNRQAILEWALKRGHPLNLGAVEEEAAGLPPITELFT